MLAAGGGGRPKSLSQHVHHVSTATLGLTRIDRFTLYDRFGGYTSLVGIAILGQM